ncbi:MAG TPA: FKBP-type peptidyl-prolyl cis-trans isomerase [Mucilaginibacter sp.]|jgi:FKBP-type peptidyl-prolyl cis-trans isomerase FkpA
MNRVLLVVLLFSSCLCACSKSNDIPAQVHNQAIIDNKIITDYLTSNGLPINNVDTVSLTTGVAAPSGVCYIVDTLGTGNDLITNSTQITVGYTGKILTTGATFAQTDNFHPSFVLGQVIRGWQLGIPASKIKKGGVVRLYIPSKYAYGPYAQPGIGLPANAVLFFNIKLYNITN